MPITKDQTKRMIELQIQSLTILKEQLEIVQLDITSGILEPSIKRIQDDIIRLYEILRAI